MLVKKLNENSDGYVALAYKNPNWQQRHYKTDKIPINDILGKLNVYISQNTFYKPSRRLENLKELRALYIDIDCYAMNITKEGALFFLEELYGEIPRPNYIVDSGRGLYYIILLKNTNYFQFPLWQTIQRYLYEKIKHLGADSKCLDATRVLRVEGSINSKTMSEVKILDRYDFEYTLEEIREHYIPEIEIEEKQKVKKKIGRPKKYKSIYNLYNLYYNRILDISKLCEIRQYNMNGYREITLFLYRYFNNIFSGDIEEALQNTLELNSMFTEPLDPLTVFKDTLSADKFYKEKKYKYSNEGLIKALNITEDEQKELRTIISKKEKYRRNNLRRYNLKRDENGMTKRQVDKNTNISNVMKLKKKGLNNTQIAKELSLSRVYVSNIINKRV